MPAKGLLSCWRTQNRKRCRQLLAWRRSPVPWACTSTRFCRVSFLPSGWLPASQDTCFSFFAAGNCLFIFTELVCLWLLRPPFLKSGIYLPLTCWWFSHYYLFFGNAPASCILPPHLFITESGAACPHLYSVCF